ncbi:MAG: hypothetical protein ABI169_01960, partial [Chitinophagaceae bacterium]
YMVSNPPIESEAPNYSRIPILQNAPPPFYLNQSSQFGGAGTTPIKSLPLLVFQTMPNRRTAPKPWPFYN